MFHTLNNYACDALRIKYKYTVLIIEGQGILFHFAQN